MSKDLRGIQNLIADYVRAYVGYRNSVYVDNYNESLTDKQWDKLVTTREIMEEEIERLLNPWQPIETAPKGADSILLGHPEGSVAVAYWGHPWDAFDQDYAWCDESTDYTIKWATHWKRKPAAPSKE